MRTRSTCIAIGACLWLLAAGPVQAAWGPGPELGERFGVLLEALGSWWTEGSEGGQRMHVDIEPNGQRMHVDIEPNGQRMHVDIEPNG